MPIRQQELYAVSCVAQGDTAGHRQGVTVAGLARYLTEAASIKLNVSTWKRNMHAFK